MPIKEPSTAAETVRATSPFNLVRFVRQVHLYLGTFFAPAILFFSISGAFQLFSLHETRPGSSYQPPAWIEKLAQVHKHQTVAVPPKRPPAPARQAKPGERNASAIPPAPRQKPVSVLATQIFFLLTALGLITTTLLGIYMAFKFNRSRALVWGMLVSGTVLPVLFLAI